MNAIEEAAPGIKSHSDSSNSMLFALADSSFSDITGRLSFSEFASLFEILNNPHAGYDVAFRAFDKGRRGCVKSDEFRAVVDDRQKRIAANPEISKIMGSVGGFKYECDLVRRYLPRSSSTGTSIGKSLDYGEFSEFFSELKGEMASQAFEAAADSDFTVSFKDLVPLIKMMAPPDIKLYMQKNLAQLLALYQHDRITYPTYKAFVSCLEKHSIIEAALAQRCKRLGRKISFAEFLSAPIVEGMAATVADTLTPLQVEIMWNIFLARGGTEVGPDDLVTKHRWRGSMKDITREQLQELASKGVDTNAPRATPAAEDGMMVVQRFKKFASGFAMAAIAGGFGAACVYPIDLGKTRVQNQIIKPGVVPLYRNTLQAMALVARTEGPAGLYRGMLPQLAGVAPEKAIKLTVNDLLRGWFAKDSRNSKDIAFPLEVLAGAGGGASQVVFTNPMEIVKIRLQMAAQNEVGGKIAVGNVLQELGIRGLYRGASACFLRDIPFSAIYFPGYAFMRSYFQGDKETPAPGDLFLAGGIAGAPAASLTTPADVIKTRMQTKLSDGSYRYSRLSEAAVDIHRNEGAAAFFKGAGARVFRSSPQFAATLFAYEMLQRVFSKTGSEYRPPTNAPVVYGREAFRWDSLGNKARDLEGMLSWW